MIAFTVLFVVPNSASIWYQHSLKVKNDAML